MNKNRREFLKTAGLAAASLNSASLFAAPARHYSLTREPSPASEKVTNMALIGAGGMGVVDMQTALTLGNVAVTAVCDLYDGRLNEAKKMWGEKIFVTK